MANGEGDGEAFKQQSMEELRYIQQVYQNQYAMINNSINMVLRELQELNSAQKTLENIGLVKGKDTLTGIGGDFYLVGKVEDQSKVLVGIGEGYVIEKDTDSAKTHAAELIKKRTEDLNRLTKNKKEVESALLEVSYRIENSR
ncbi:MAG: prefoldin subunit alpha [Candidatus Micrarchaeota archaeon]|nr:prefoldin subunit alpha [Candidatus Micrarchaeota archaeon]